MYYNAEPGTLKAPAQKAIDDTNQDQRATKRFQGTSTKGSEYRKNLPGRMTLLVATCINQVKDLLERLKHAKYPLRTSYGENS